MLSQAKDGAKFPFLSATLIHRVGVICHRHADPDAYMSAYAIARLVSAVAPSAHVDIVLPDGMSLLTQRLGEA